MFENTVHITLYLKLHCISQRRPAQCFASLWIFATTCSPLENALAGGAMQRLFLEWTATILMNPYIFIGPRYLGPIFRILMNSNIFLQHVGNWWRLHHQIRTTVCNLHRGITMFTRLIKPLISIHFCQIILVDTMFRKTEISRLISIHFYQINVSSEWW